MKLKVRAFWRRWRDQVVVAGVFIVIGGAVMVWFVTFGAPPARQPRAKLRPMYAEAPLEETLQKHAFESRLREIAAAGSRMTGTPGCLRVEALISNVFQHVGLEVMTQAFDVTVPVTEVCEIRDAETGRLLEGVQLYPFMPAGLMPISCVLTTRLVTAESAELRWLSGHDPRDVVMVTTVDGGATWAELAAAGAPALIVHDDPAQRLLRANADQTAAWTSLLPGDESPFPCFYATGPITSFTGRLVTVNCRVIWQRLPARNVLGVLRGRTPRTEALVVTAYYDSSSVVPDLAPGAEQSIPLAAMLDLAVALAPYRGDLSRDIIFVATAGHAQGLAGVVRLMEALECFSAVRSDFHSFEFRRKNHVAALHALDNDPEIVRIAAGEIHLRRKEECLNARLAYLRAGSPVYRDGFDIEQGVTDAERQSSSNMHPLLQAYLQTRRQADEAANLVSMPPAVLLSRPEYRMEIERLRTQAGGWHQERIHQLDDLIRIRDLFAAYRKTLTLNIDLTSGGSRQQAILSLLVGIGNAGPAVEPQVSAVANLMIAKTPGIEVFTWGARDAAGSSLQPNRNSAVYTELESEPWFHCGRLAFSLCNHAFQPPKLCTPEDTLDGLKFDVLRTHVPAVGRLALALAGGQVEFKMLSAVQSKSIGALHGRVLGEAGAATLVPSHPMGSRTVVRVVREASWVRGLTPLDTRGVNIYPVITCSPYGTYERPLFFDVAKYARMTVDAARFDAQGRVVFYTDRGASGQSVYPSASFDATTCLAMAGRTPSPVNAGVFRCAPVALYPFSNPQTQQPFKQMRMLANPSLMEPPRINSGRIITFLEPDFCFFIGFLDGAVANPEICVARAFMLNVDDLQPPNSAEMELAGRGYLAADTPVLSLPQFDAAASMLRTAGKRLTLQQRFGMTDEQTLTLHARSTNLLHAARVYLGQREPLAAMNAGSASLAYAMANHPVITGKIYQAVFGILWYLGLLVPFVFFAEKLLFGFSDIRRQLMAAAAIFLIVFGLLRTFHPAFEMVRSSLMILLGFVILLLTMLVTLMIGGKFRQNIKDLRRRAGQVEGADVNRGGVLGTALLLGLNNMRRRKVRTGLTCVTLILITFVMICFTSVSTDLVDIEYATGRSPWNGIMIRDGNYRGLATEQINSLRRIYGTTYPVATIRWLLPAMHATLMDRLQNLEIQVEREWRVGAQTINRRVILNSAVEMSWQEPWFSGLDGCLLTHRGWFPKPPETSAEISAAVRDGQRERNYVMLPIQAAQDLGVTPSNVDASNVVVTIRGEAYDILGIFDPTALARVQGLDGRSLMPFDLNSIQQLGSQAGTFVVPEDIGRLTPAQVMIVNRMPTLKSEETPTVFCSVLFPAKSYRLRSDMPEQSAVDYGEQRRLVADYLERLGKPAFYAVDGTSYYGERRRSRTWAGMLQLLVPLLIAALTVFNTMRGSVYERRSEIYTYNAVGIAPNHVFCMFMAEACVYAVIGAICGYVLSQATGRVLTALGLTGGLNLDYSSIETIYASLAIMSAALLSALLPARDAARLASPSGMTGWSLPDIQNNCMEFDLPFTFTPYDRVAVVGYFYRWMEANGTGSAGPFYCAPPAVILKTGTALTPALRSTVWLKPYDLGVSQRVEISLPPDLEIKEFVAHIRLTLISGHTAAWRRTVKPFLGSLRKQFLNWRATTSADRAEMFDEASRLLREMGQREDDHV